MEFLFWGIMLIWAVLGFVGSRWPAYAPYSWGPAFILFLILGFKVMGFPH